MRRSKTLGLVLATVMVVPVGAWANEFEAADGHTSEADDGWDEDDSSSSASSASSDSEDSSSTEDSVHAAEMLHAFDFEDGLQGWTVEDGLYSEDTWVHTDDADGSRGAVALSGYHNEANTTIVSPALHLPEAAVLEFRASYWLESCAGCDWVDVFVRSADGAEALVDTIYGRGRWPLWDHHRYNIPLSGHVQVGFRFSSDYGCAGGPVKPSTYESQLNLTMCGTGFWFDNIRMGSAAQFQDSPRAWGDGPQAHPIVWPVASELPAATFYASMLTPDRVASAGSYVGRNEFDDQMANPEFLAAFEQRSGEVHMDDWWRDPMIEWEGVLGRTREAWFLNRYRTPTGVRLHAPLDGGPHPLVIFVGMQGGAGWTVYDSMINRLVQEGYAVASIVPQGDGSYSSLRSAVLPAPEFCGPIEATGTQWWRQPQEGGLVEEQTCAGFNGSFAWSTIEELGDAYRTSFGAPFVFSTLDALDWLLGTRNPWGSLIDADAGVGAFGNSAGAWAAMAAAQVDERIVAAAMLDGYGHLDGLEPTTPTLALAYDQHEWLDGAWANPLGVANGLRAAGVDTGFLHHLDTGHADSAWSPFTNGDAVVGAAYAHNHLGNVRNALAKPIHQHYLLAWFDRYLKGDPTGAERLTLAAFDGSADRTAQGQGRWLPGEGNEPYRIEGLSVAETLNHKLTSWFHLDGQETVLAG